MLCGRPIFCFSCFCFNIPENCQTNGSKGGQVQTPCVTSFPHLKLERWATSMAPASHMHHVTSKGGAISVSPAPQDFGLEVIANDHVPESVPPLGRNWTETNTSHSSEASVSRETLTNAGNQPQSDNGGPSRLFYGKRKLPPLSSPRKLVGLTSSTSTNKGKIRVKKQENDADKQETSSRSSTPIQIMFPFSNSVGNLGDID